MPTTTTEGEAGTGSNCGDSSRSGRMTTGLASSPSHEEGEHGPGDGSSPSRYTAEHTDAAQDSAMSALEAVASVITGSSDKPDEPRTEERERDDEQQQSNKGGDNDKAAKVMQDTTQGLSNSRHSRNGSVVVTAIAPGNNISTGIEGNGTDNSSLRAPLVAGPVTVGNAQPSSSAAAAVAMEVAADDRESTETGNGNGNGRNEAPSSSAAVVSSWRARRALSFNITARRYGVCSMRGKRDTQEDAHSVHPCPADSTKKDASSEDKREFEDERKQAAVTSASTTMAAAAADPVDVAREDAANHASESSLHSQQQKQKPNPAKSCFFAVFDGHGGDRCSEFVAERLPKILFDHEQFGIDMAVAIRESLQAVEDAWAELSLRDMVDGGTTAIMALLSPPNILHLCAVGDSEAVLCRAGKAIRPLPVHNMKNNPVEEARVRACGGRIYKNRVAHPVFNPHFFSIAVTRAIGDIMYKHEKYTQGKPSGLILEPDMAEIVLTTGDEFLILACDGVWDVMTAQNAVDFVRKEIARLGGTSVCDWNDVAKALARKAFVKGSLDNITVLVVSLD